MKVICKSLPLFMTLALTVSMGCQPKESEAARAAQEEAKAADARVNALEQQLADLKAGKHTAGAKDPATTEHVTKSQAKALERQLADARSSAATKHKAADDMAKAPASNAPRPVIVDVAQGTVLSVKPSRELSTSTVQAGDPWEGTLAADIVVEGRTVWRAGTAVGGVVTQSTPAGRLRSGSGGLGIKVTRVGEQDVDTAAYVVVGDKRGTRNAKFIGGGAALGALVGILSDNRNQGDHALGGAAIGAAAGTAAAAASADTVIRVPAGRDLTFTLSAPEKVTLKP